MTEYIYGRRNVAEFLESLKHKGIRAADRVQHVYVNRESTADLGRLLEPLKNLPRSEVSRKDLDGMTGTKNHQGILLALKASSQSKQGLAEFMDYIQSYDGLVLLLDRIQDAGNLGNILRTAECFGVKCIVLPERDAADITDAVVRISSGAVHHLEIFKVTNLRQCLEPMKKAGFWLIAADDEGTENPDFPDTPRLGLIMGNEKDGIKRILKEESDFTVRIPMRGHVSSLNVAVSTGILLDRLINR